MKEYVRKLTPTEAERYYITITKDARGMFPSPTGKIRLYHEGKPFELKIDKFHRLYLGKIRPHFSMEEGDTVIISKEAPPRTYSISKR